MDLSLWPSTIQPWSDVLHGARHADATGWHAVYVADHFMGPGRDEDVPWREATAQLAALAALTERVRLSPLVLSATYRHPAVVANWAVAVDQISDGRLTLGLGAGWQENEHQRYGIDMGTPGARRRRFEEYLRVVRGLLDGETVDHAGDWFELTGARCPSRPVQPRLPILIGAKGERMLGVVARQADEWNIWSLPASMAVAAERLARHCDEIGRDPATIRRSTQALVLLTDDRSEAAAFVERAGRRAAVAGPPEVFAETVAGWAEAGVDEVIVPDWDLGPVEGRADAMDLLRTAVAELGDL
jgi:alkanesulfonate monooxygenase SsuD/methylene tetrahydromethanopterin reductase-like flavin-dependent oxidoreductase (luciferase family)